MTSTWMPRERWDALVRGDGCPLCAEIASGEAENAYGFAVADLRISHFRLSREQHVPGWCVLTCRRHVRKPHELAPEERGDFFTDLKGQVRHSSRPTPPTRSTTRFSATSCRICMPTAALRLGK